MSKLNSLKRRPPKRDQRPRLLVMCGGKVSEPEYLEYVRQMLNVPPELCKIERSGEVPETLFKSALKRMRNPVEDFSRVFIVIDKDDFDLRPVLNMASAQGVAAIVSNPNFEVWLLLHFQEHSSLCNRTEVRNKLKKYLPDYVKKPPMEKLWPSYSLAKKRAELLCKRHEGVSLHNARPISLMHIVIDAMLSAYSRK